MDRLLKRPQANFNILVDISILAAAAHLLLAENEQSTSACVGLSSLSRPDSHSSAELGPNVECIIKIQREGAIDQYSICLDLTEKH